MTAEEIAEKWTAPYKFGGIPKECAADIERYADQFKIRLSPDRIITQEEFRKVYEHYQSLLVLEDASGWYHEQFLLANERAEKAEKELQDLKAQIQSK